MGVNKETIESILCLSSQEDGLTYGRGFFTRRCGYFWTPKCSPEEYFAKQKGMLERAGLILSDVSYGDIWKTLKGGAGIKNNSHFWMKFRAKWKE